MRYGFRCLRLRREELVQRPGRKHLKVRGQFGTGTNEETYRLQLLLVLLDEGRVDLGFWGFESGSCDKLQLRVAGAKIW